GDATRGCTPRAQTDPVRCEGLSQSPGRAHLRSPRVADPLAAGKHAGATRLMDAGLELIRQESYRRLTQQLQRMESVHGPQRCMSGELDTARSESKVGDW